MTATVKQAPCGCVYAGEELVGCCNTHDPIAAYREAFARGMRLLNQAGFTVKYVDR